MTTWYSQGPEEFDLHASADDARAAAESMLEHYSDNATSDGEWNTDIGDLQWGRLVPHEVANIHEMPAPEGFPDGEYWDVTLVPCDDELERLRREVELLRQDNDDLRQLIDARSKRQLKRQLNAALRAAGELMCRERLARERISELERHVETVLVEHQRLQQYLERAEARCTTLRDEVRTRLQGLDRELLLRAATALRAVVHSSVGSRELLDLAEQLEHAMGDPEPRG